MDDLHRLLDKFDVHAKSLDADLSKTERRLARERQQPTTLEEWRAELAVYEDALAIAATRDRDLAHEEAEALARRDTETAEALRKRRLEIALEVPRLQKTLATIRERITAFPTASR